MCAKNKKQGVYEDTRLATRKWKEECRKERMKRRMQERAWAQERGRKYYM